MGCINANNSDFFYTQTKNAIEFFLKYEKANDGLSHWTETCGPTSLWNGCEAMGIDIKPKSGQGLIRPADYIFVYMNNPSVFNTFTEWHGCVPGALPSNEVQGWFGIAMTNLFGIDTAYHEGLSFSDVCNIVSTGHAVQLSRTIGHFIVAVDYDATNDLLVYWDSFNLFINPDGSLTDDGTNGFRRTMNEAWFNANISPRFVEIIG
jgi:hypothetical protein